MSDRHDTKKAALEADRTELLERIDELTVGGEIDLDFDDDFADRGQVASEQGENHTLADTLQAQLNLIDGALSRIAEGTYGACEICGATIGAERLDAMPATPRCITHAS